MATNGSQGLGGQMPMFGNSSMGQQPSMFGSSGMRQQMPMFGNSSMGQQPPMFGNTSMGMGQMQPMGRQPMGGQQRADDNPPGVPPEYETHPNLPPGYFMLPNPGGPPGVYERKGPGMSPVDPVKFNKPDPGNWIQQLINDGVGGPGMIGTQAYELLLENPQMFYNILQHVAPDSADDIENKVKRYMDSLKDKMPSLNPLDWF